MPRPTLSGSTAVLALTVAALALLLQTPVAIPAVLAGLLVCLGAGLLAFWRLLAAARRGLPLLPRARGPCAVVLAVVAGIAGGFTAYELRVAAARRRAEAIAEQLETLRALNGRYPLTLDELPGAPELPAFAEQGFYAIDADRRSFSLRLTRRNLGLAWWEVYDSTTRRWTTED